jgi:hypothetical protein
MTLLFSVLGVAFVASCIWLTVRIVNRRERWAKRTLLGIVVGVPLAYVVSFGPACWWFPTPSSDPDYLEGVPLPTVKSPRVYWPLGWLAVNSHRSVERTLAWYATLGRHEILVPTNAEATGWWIP